MLVKVRLGLRMELLSSLRRSNSMGKVLVVGVVSKVLASWQAFNVRHFVVSCMGVRWKVQNSVLHGERRGWRENHKRQWFQ